MKRSKKRARGNPLKGKTEPMREITHQGRKPSDGKSLGFGRDRTRAHGVPTPPVAA